MNYIKTKDGNITCANCVEDFHQDRKRDHMNSDLLQNYYASLTMNLSFPDDTQYMVMKGTIEELLSSMKNLCKIKSYELYHELLISLNT